MQHRGRLLDHIGKDNLNVLGARILVLDEYDKCLELGFREEMYRIGESMHFVSQVVVVSATAFEEEKRDVWGERVPETNAEGKSKKVLPVPAFVAQRKFVAINYLDTADDLASRLKVCQIPSPQKDKLETLAQLLTHIGGASTIVFVAHRESVDRGRAISSRKRISHQPLSWRTRPRSARTLTLSFSFGRSFCDGQH